MDGYTPTIDLTVIPPSVEAGACQSTPFTVSISAHDDGPHVIDLYSQYSNSNPYQDPQNKWSHLVPQWRFLDVDGNVVSQVTTVDTSLSSGNTFIGVTGEAQFYYMDDLGSTMGFPSVLWATMQTSGFHIESESNDGNVPVPSYANSKVVAYTPYYINGLLPDHLEITRDGIVPLSGGIYWKGHKIPNMITIAPKRLCNSPISANNILFTVPETNAEGTAMGAIDKRIETLELSSQTWKSLDNGTEDSYFQKFDTDGFDVAGYVRNTVTPYVSSLNANISATVGITASSYNIPLNGPYYDTPFMWVPDPNNNVMHRISYPNVDQTIVDLITSWLYDDFSAVSTQTDVPFLTSTSDVVGLTGFGGIYGIAVDPCYNVWCADAERDKLLKFGWDGTLLQTINLDQEPEFIAEAPFAESEGASIFNDTYWNHGGNSLIPTLETIATGKDWVAVTSIVASKAFFYKRDTTDFRSNDWEFMQQNNIPVNPLAADMYNDERVIFGGFGSNAIYDNVDGTWQYLTGYSNSNDHYSVAVADDHFIIASYPTTYIYTQTDDGLILSFNETVPDLHENALHIDGRANFVDVYENTATIGTIRSYSDEGAIQVYDYDSNTETWTFTQEITAYNSSYFSYSVQIHGDWIIAREQPFVNKGLHCFKKTNGSWTSAQYIDLSQYSVSSWGNEFRLYNNRLAIKSLNQLEQAAIVFRLINNVWELDGEYSTPDQYASGQVNAVDVNDTHLFLTQEGGTGSALTANFVVFPTDDVAYTPTDLCFDSDLNMYIPLYDGQKTAKYNTAGEYQYSITPTSDYVDTVSGTNNFLYAPIMVETDKDDNVWTTYNQTLCSVMHKHDSTGTILSTIAFPLCANPMDILVDYDNNVWVTLTYQAGPPYYQGIVRKYNGVDGSIMADVSAVHPEYLTMDRDGDIWYTFEVNSVGKIDNTTYSVVSSDVGAYPTSSWFVALSPQYYNFLEGIAADSSDRVWVINSYENVVYVLSGTPDNTINTVTLPSSGYERYDDINTQQQILSSEWFKALQANGDWTGFRWLQKYNMLDVDTVSSLSGTSGPFDINMIETYDIRKFNESWDAETQIRDYALPEHLYNNSNLFVDYIGTMIGGLETSAQSIGRKVYERIANFVPNHSDIDTCNIPQLHSLAQQLDVPIDNYNFTFPAELKRLMDILSIHQRKLWGDRCKCNLNFRSEHGVCANCGHSHPSNIGDGINTDTYAVSAGVPFIAEYKFSRSHHEVIAPLSNYSSVYNVASTYLLNAPADYCYFAHNTDFCAVQNEGVIEWDSDYTTLDESVSSLESWIGDQETVEKMLSYQLHKGLGFDEE